MTGAVFWERIMSEMIIFVLRLGKTSTAGPFSLMKFISAITLHFNREKVGTLENLPLLKHKNVTVCLLRNHYSTVVTSMSVSCKFNMRYWMKMGSNLVIVIMMPRTLLWERWTLFIGGRSFQNKFNIQFFWMESGNGNIFWAQNQIVLRSPWGINGPEIKFPLKVDTTQNFGILWKKIIYIILLGH